MPEQPTNAECFFFDNNGYLVLERFLPEDLTGRLLEASLFYVLDDDPLFLDMLDYPPIVPYVKRLLNPKPHHHASDIIVEYPQKGRGPGWHLDGHDDGYRRFGFPIPLLQLKVGYYLTDMTETGRGNLCVVPGSHKARLVPDPDDLRNPELFPGAVPLCGPAGTAILFHNALWHTAGPWTRDDGCRVMLYIAYEHPWMMASAEHWGYPSDFYRRLSPERRSYFHGFLFDPPELRWG